MNNQSSLAPINVTQPSTAGQANVSLVKSDFDALIAQKGYEVYLDKVVHCPCRRVGDHQPMSSCRSCGGSSYTYINRYKTKMVIQSMNYDTKYKEWSEERVGSAKITARDEENLAFMDRITVIGAETTTSQVIFPKNYYGSIKGKVIYDIKAIEEIFAFVGDNQKLKKLEVNIDYTLSGNIITFVNSYSNWEDFTVSIRYRHEPTFHIIDLVREVMTTPKVKGGVEIKQSMPVSAIARRSHYVLDEQNFSGDYLLDNSYSINNCKNKSDILIDPPAKFRLQHPTSTSIILNWNDVTTTETSFVIERSGLDGIWTQIAITVPNTITYTDTVTANTTYFYRMATRQGEKQSIWTNSLGITTNV
jgi:hypothetical protein